MEESRTVNSARNASVTIISKVIYIIISFICRTIFIQTLGTEYLGVNGLFTNVLTMLSFAELGIGTAIIYKMYKPIAEDDRERIKTLIHFYKKVYFIIGIVILVMGLCLIPFLHYFIKEQPNISENLIFIYILFLINSTMSYFFVYKRSIITGHQKDYILSLISLVISIVLDILQIILLLITHNYIVYLLLQIGATLLDNIIASKKADKMYPYIKEKEYKKLDKAEQKSIFNDIKSLFFYQLGYVLSTGTDNIIISTFLGVGAVGLLSNYTIITSSIKNLLDSVFKSITSSIGNLNTIKEKAKKESVFYQIMFISFIVYGYISIAMTLLINDFVTIWLGNNYILGLSISIALGLDFYINGMRYVNYTYRNTLGLFRKGRFVPIITALANVILSIILVNYMGMFGVLIATSITRLFILTSYEPYFIHKNAFGTSPLRYYKTYAYYFFVTAIAFIISGFVINIIPIQGILGFIVDGILITGIVMVIFVLFTFKTEQYKQVKERIYYLINKKKNIKI